MSTLLIRLAAPLQSWGVDSKFETRRTQELPSKSGVIGLLAAALGRRRDESVEDLCALFMGVRIDRPGVLLRDYQTAQAGEKNTYISNRYYLSDAVFLVGLESDNPALLEKLEQALQHPVFPLFLGRRSCPPTLPLSLGVRQPGVLRALQEEPCLTGQETRDGLRIWCDAPDAQGELRRQRTLPVSFSPINRQFASHFWKDCGRVQLAPGRESTTHDAMAEL